MQPTSPTDGTPHDHGPTTPPPQGPDAKPQAADSRRDSHGRFGKGNSGGPGNPFARQVAALRCALLSAVSEQDLDEVARELVRQAKEGNLAAAKLLLSYTLGKPAAAPVDPDTLDLHEFGLYRALPDPTPDMIAAGKRVGLPFALNYLRTALPGFSAEQEQQLADGIADQIEQEQRQAADRDQRRARREARKPEKAAPSVDEAALARLGRMLGLTPPSANGISGQFGPSPNGRKRPGPDGRDGRG